MTAFSVVIPAHNAQRTLDVPLASLRAQTLDTWEAIIVDDGSTDDTLVLATAASDSDPRIRVVTQTNGGVSSARNRGLAESSHDWVLFLDADDHIAPPTFALLAARLQQRPDVDAVRFDWAYESTDGRMRVMPSWDLQEDSNNLFEVSARLCPFAIHACVTRKELLESCGGFDTDLIAGEDWDLWQRVGRKGGKMAYLPEVLAFYVLHLESATHKNFGRVLTDCLEVISRAHRPDDRVSDPLPQFASGLPPDGELKCQLSTFLWTFSLAIGAQGAVEPLLDGFSSPGRGWIGAEAVAEAIFYSVPIGAGRTPEEWPVLWPATDKHLEAAVKKLAAWDGGAHLSGRIMRRVEARVLIESDGSLGRAGQTKMIDAEFGGTFRTAVLDSEISRVIVRFVHNGLTVGTVQVPVIEGRVEAEVIRAAFIDQLATDAARLAARTPRLAPALLVGGIRTSLSPALWRATGSTLRGLGRRQRRELKLLVRAATVHSVARSALADWTGSKTKAPSVVPSAPRFRRPELSVTRRLPILMYHRVAEDGPEVLGRYRVSSQRFEEQLDFLRRHGFTSVGLDEWAKAIGRGRGLPGPRVELTFDDGYEDVLDNGLPLLKEYGFTATVFVVTDLVGTASTWDADLGETAPLMSWSALRAMRDQGVTIASHTATHTHLTGLTPDEVVQQERRARVDLEQHLGAAVDIVAYPYGDIDAVQRQTMRQAGYRVGVTTRSGISHRFEHPMDLSRLEVMGDTTIDEFGAMVEPRTGR